METQRNRKTGTERHRETQTGRDREGECVFVYVDVCGHHVIGRP